MTYKESITSAIDVVKTSGTNIFTAILEIAMAGELSEWEKDVAVGEEFLFTLELFKSLNDQNIDQLVALLDDMDAVLQSLHNINGIERKEED